MSATQSETPLPALASDHPLGAEQIADDQPVTEHAADQYNAETRAIGERDMGRWMPGLRPGNLNPSRERNALMSKITQAGLVLGLLTGIAAPSADAQTAAYTFTTAPVATTSAGTTQVRNQPVNPVDPFGGSIGFTFAVGTGGITVSSLGYLDFNAGGALNDSHTVNLYSYVTVGSNSTPTLLATTTITPSTPQTPDANGYLFAYSSLTTPVYLPATGAASGSTGYEIMADLTRSVSGGHAGDAFVDKMALANTPFASPITSGGFGASHYSSTGGGAFSTLSVNQDAGYFGPNFQFTAAPEPSQTVALGLGVFGLAALAVKARKRRGCAD